VVDVTGGVGAAVFALRAAGHEPAVPVVRTIGPQRQAAGRYDELYPVYRGLYPRLRETMAPLAGRDGGGYQ
jgi:sugar (pentulose or hexulose) kinase